MGNNFVKLKTKYFVAAILKSVIFGIACGLFAAGAVMLPLKLCSVTIHFGYYILIGAGTAALSGGAFFACLYKFGLSDRAIAKKLDKDYELNERVQTVVEYGEEQSDIMNLLREDTEDRLANLPKRKLTFAMVMSAIWFYVVISVLSLALFLSAIFIPAPEAPPEPEPPPVDVVEDPAFEYTLELQSKMYDLMRDVMNSNLQEAEKDALTKILEDLDKQVLPALEKKSQLDIAITAAVYALNDIVGNANTFLTVSEKLKETDEDLSQAIIEGVIIYKSFSYKLVDLDMVRGLYSRVNSNIDETLERYFTASFEAHKFTEEDSVVQGGVVIEYANNLGSVLSDLNESGLDEDDKFYAAIANFRKGINGVYNKFLQGGHTAYSLNEGQENSVKLAYSPDLKNSVIEAALLQSYNCIMGVYVREMLGGIFEVSLKDVPELYADLKPSESENNGSENNGESSGGGFGDGSENYGSKDFIYDTDSGEQVEYGKVYNDYYSKVDDRIKSGDLPQDLVDFIEEYFKILLNGIKNENSEEN